MQAVGASMLRTGQRCSCACTYAGQKNISSKPRSTSTMKVKKLVSRAPQSKLQDAMPTDIFVPRLARTDSSDCPASMQRIDDIHHLPGSRSYQISKIRSRLLSGPKILI